jgi:hypothetical protein
MQISDKMKALVRIGKRLAKDPEFLKQTEHRRKAVPKPSPQK